MVAERLEGKGYFANLTIDMPFKKTFGSETEKEPLIAMLNAFLEKKLAYPIIDVDIKNPYIIGQTKYSRDAELDIRCRDSQGNQFIVEMQIGKQKHFVKRANFYSSMAIADVAPKGEKDWDYSYPNVYSLNFLNFDFDFWKSSDSIVRYVSFSDEELPELRFDFVNLVFVRLSKFEKSLDECESLQDKLLFSLRHAHEFDEQPEKLSGELFDKIFLAAKVSRFTSDEYSAYRAGLMRRWDDYATLSYAKEEAMIEGVEKGRAEGRAEGILQTARQMKAKGFNVAVIAEITGLPEAEIERLDF